MRTGDCIETASGKLFYVTDPSPKDVCIDDIAHALSLVNRFGGHTTDSYSVAQHCVHVHDLVKEKYPYNYYLQLYGLLHDASEAYLGDVVRPLKKAMPDYQSYEKRVSNTILKGLGVSLPLPPDLRKIKWFDDIMLLTERRDLFLHPKNGDAEWPDEVPREEKIQLWHWSEAKYQFLLRYYLTSTYEKENRP